MDKNGFKIGSYQCHSKELPKQGKLKKGHNNIAKAKQSMMAIKLVREIQNICNKIIENFE